MAGVEDNLDAPDLFLDTCDLLLLCIWALASALAGRGNEQAPSRTGQKKEPTLPEARRKCPFKFRLFLLAAYSLCRFILVFSKLLSPNVVVPLCLSSIVSPDRPIEHSKYKGRVSKKKTLFLVKFRAGLNYQVSSYI